MLTRLAASARRQVSAAWCSCPCKVCSKPGARAKTRGGERCSRWLTGLRPRRRPCWRLRFAEQFAAHGQREKDGRPQRGGWVEQERPIVAGQAVERLPRQPERAGEVEALHRQVTAHGGHFYGPRGSRGQLLGPFEGPGRGAYGPFDVLKPALGLVRLSHRQQRPGQTHDQRRPGGQVLFIPFPKPLDDRRQVAAAEQVAGQRPDSFSAPS